MKMVFVLLSVLFNLLFLLIDELYNTKKCEKECLAFCMCIQQHLFIIFKFNFNSMCNMCVCVQISIYLFTQPSELKLLEVLALIHETQKCSNVKITKWVMVLMAIWHVHLKTQQKIINVTLYSQSDQTNLT